MKEFSYAQIEKVYPHVKRVTGIAVAGKAGMMASLAFRALEREIGPFATEVENARRELINTYSKKDKDGKVVVDGNDMVVFVEETVGEFIEAANTLYGNKVGVKSVIRPGVLVDASDWIGEVSADFMDAIYPFTDE